jgi:hypothetical protein
VVDATSAQAQIDHWSSAWRSAIEQRAAPRSELQKQRHEAKQCRCSACAKKNQRLKPQLKSSGPAPCR